MLDLRYTVAPDFTPRRLLREHLNIDLPISGGWGYGKSDAVIINKNDPSVNPDIPFDGVSIEYVYVEKRLEEELVNLPEDGDGFVIIKSSLIEQQLHQDDKRQFDMLRFEVIALPEGVVAEWKIIMEQNQGNPEFDHDSHLNGLARMRQVFEYDFWFDITSFYAQQDSQEV